LKITLNILEDININEIGLYNNNEILFYTGMSTLFVKKDTQLVLYYTLYGMTISIIE
jgi:hypothetical protein